MVNAKDFPCLWGKIMVAPEKKSIFMLAMTVSDRQIALPPMHG